jgi:hypothetical protein
MGDQRADLGRVGHIRWTARCREAGAAEIVEECIECSRIAATGTNSVPGMGEGKGRCSANSPGSAGHQRNWRGHDGRY